MVHRLTKIDAHIAIWGVVATALTALVGGEEMFPSAMVGAAVASLNWIAFRKLAVRLVSSEQKVGLGVFLAVKTLMLLGGIVLLLTFLPIHPVAFLVGMSGLFAGIVSSSIGHTLNPTETPLERKI
jgi:hypothetical protein